MTPERQPTALDALAEHVPILSGDAEFIIVQVREGVFAIFTEYDALKWSSDTYPEEIAEYLARTQKIDVPCAGSGRLQHGTNSLLVSGTSDALGSPPPHATVLALFRRALADPLNAGLAHKELRVSTSAFPENGTARVHVFPYRAPTGT